MQCRHCQSPDTIPYGRYRLLCHSCGRTSSEQSEEARAYYRDSNQKRKEKLKNYYQENKEEIALARAKRENKPLEEYAHRADYNIVLARKLILDAMEDLQSYNKLAKATKVSHQTLRNIVFSPYRQILTSTLTKLETFFKKNLK